MSKEKLETRVAKLIAGEVDRCLLESEYSCFDREVTDRNSRMFCEEAETSRQFYIRLAADVIKMVKENKK